MIQAAAGSMRRRGLVGTSFTEVLKESDAARGAIYHHFPRGKDELAEAAVRWTGETVGEQIAALQPTDLTAHEVVRAFLQLVRPVVEESAGGAGCAVAAATTASELESPLRLAAGGVLRDWRALLAGHLTDVGMDAAGAAALAALMLTTLEGAHVLCRAERSIEPFDAAATALLAGTPR
jgi:AcrR family transcriptional regulator